VLCCAVLRCGVVLRFAVLICAALCGFREVVPGNAATRRTLTSLTDRVAVAAQVRIVDAGAVPPLVDVLRSEESQVVREAARAIGNLCANVDFAAMFFKLGIVPQLITMLRSSDITAARMAAMCLSNLATNVKNQVRRACDCLITCASRPPPPHSL
jgi:hypothetical protein